MSLASIPKWPVGYVVALFFSFLTVWYAFLFTSTSSVVIACICLGLSVGLMVATELWSIRRASWMIGRTTLVAGVFYWFVLGAVWLAVLHPPFQNFSPFYPGFGATIPLGVVVDALLAVNLFLAAAMFGWRMIVSPRKFLRRLSDRTDPRDPRTLEYFALALAILAWLPILYAYQLNFGLFSQELLKMRAGDGLTQMALVGPLQHTYLLGVFAGALATVRIFYGMAFSRLLFLLTLALVFPLVFFGGGSRFNLAYLILPAFLLLAAPVVHSVDRKRRKTLAIAMAIIVLLVFGLQASIRNTGVGGSAESLTVSEVVTAGSGGSDHFGALVIAIDFVHRRGEFFMEPAWPYFLTHLIPSTFWSGKPYPKSWTEYNSEVTQGQPFNVTPSVIGQYYMNWGFPGVIYIGLFFGAFARFCDDWFLRLDIKTQFSSATLAGIALTFLFLSFRYFSPIYFVYPFFGYLSYRLITRRVFE